MLGKWGQRCEVRLYVFVLMDHHCHLVLELTEANLSRAGQWFKLGCGAWFKRRPGRRWTFLAFQEAKKCVAILRGIGVALKLQWGGRETSRELRFSCR